MFQDNLKAMRRQKGFTQEALAIQLHVVRQTVSKWEKGLSVPDADLLQRLAEALEVSVDQLLGAELPKQTAEQDALAAQLARINEQLAMRNRRARRVWRGVLIAAVLLALVPAILIGLGVARYTPAGREAAGSVAWRCALDGEEYTFEIEYDDGYRVMASGGDAWLIEQAGLDDASDANALAARLEAFVEGQGGTVALTEATGLPLRDSSEP